jgi:hypothetical protein
MIIFGRTDGDHEALPVTHVHTPVKAIGPAVSPSPATSLNHLITLFITIGFWFLRDRVFRQYFWCLDFLMKY